MKFLTDWALICLYDTAHESRVRTDDVDTTESMAGELMRNRALFGTFERLTAYCLERTLVLRCDFGTVTAENSAPGWAVRIGTISRDPAGGDSECFQQTAGVSGPILGDLVRELAVHLGLVQDSMPESPMH